MRIILTAALLGLSAVGAAQAADLAVPPAVATEAFDWSGFYLGATAGAGLLTASVPAEYGYEYGSYYGNIDYSAAGGLLGIGASAKLQSGSFVYGIDADVSYSNLQADGSTYPDYYYSSATWNWLATLRATAGLAVDKTLFYATAGVAAVGATYDICAYTGCDDDYYDTHRDTTQVGLVVGAGVETAIADNLTFKGEVLYVGLPDYVTDVDYDDYYTATLSSNAVLARAGLNWKF